MSDKPILFSGPMVRALLEGRKTQTRRVLKPQPTGAKFKGIFTDTNTAIFGEDGQDVLARTCEETPIKYAVGDRLWVREAHYLTDDGESEFAVFSEDESAVSEHLEQMQTTMASHPNINWSKHLRLRPSIHMPRWASRLTLIVTDVRIQRLQEISEDDAKAEGCRGYVSQDGEDGESPREEFRALWDGLNAKRDFGWDVNPFVAAYTFTVHKCNIDKMGGAS